MYKKLLSSSSKDRQPIKWPEYKQILTRSIVWLPSFKFVTGLSSEPESGAPFAWTNPRSRLEIRSTEAIMLFLHRDSIMLVDSGKAMRC